MVIADIRASNLQQAYLDVSQNILLLQKLAQQVATQEPLNLIGDSRLASQVREFQSQFKTKAIECQNNLLPEYNTNLTSALNFHALFESFVTIGEPLITQAAAVKASSIAMQISKDADEINQQTNMNAQNFGGVYNSLSQLQSQFDSALDEAIRELDYSKNEINQDIDKFRNALKKNINDIGEGSAKVGDALCKFGISVLMNRTNVDAVNTIVESLFSTFTGVQKGVTESAQASADFNSNRKELTATFKKLARKDTLLTIAELIRFTNQQFISQMQETELKISKIAAMWGESPVQPPGSGISLGFYQYAQQINAIKTPADTNQLLALLHQARFSWSLLKDSLNNIRQQVSN